MSIASAQRKREVSGYLADARDACHVQLANWRAGSLRARQAFPSPFPSYSPRETGLACPAVALSPRQPRFAEALRGGESLSA